MRAPIFIAVGGGKGGVGKTFISTSLGTFLAESGYRTLILDFDLGGANVHTFLGMEPSSFCLDSALKGERKKLSDIVLQSNVTNLYVVLGAREYYRSMSIKTFMKNRFIREIKKLDFDFVIADLGAGTSLFTLDVFIHADAGIGVVSPESASMDNFFRFLKCAFYRKVEVLWRKYKSYFGDTKIEVENLAYPHNILNLLEMHSPEGGRRIREEIEEMRTGVIVNMATRESDAGVGEFIKRISESYLGINVHYHGWIPFSPEVRPKVNGGLPLIYQIADRRLKDAISRITFSILRMFGERRNEGKLLSFAWSQSRGY